MNPPQVYMCAPPWTLLPPHTIPLGRPSALAPSIQYRASNLDWLLWGRKSAYQNISDRNEVSAFFLHQIKIPWIL